MQTTKTDAPAFKTVDEVKEDFQKKAVELNLDASLQEPLLTFFMEENRQAWIRGKEYGWKKAWNWKRKQAQA